ncbi:MAG: lactate utilization protein [Gemmataceae bacterium]|nr:lactate utilization protein [Gemmataceae bacterium]
MTSSRDSFLQRVRQAVAQGNRPGVSAPLPSRGNVGYQGAGADPVFHFRDALAAAGGFPHVVPDRDSAVARVLDLVRQKSARRALLGRGPFLDSLNLSERLRAEGIEVLAVDAFTPQTCRDPFFAADIGISGVDHLIAETGSVAVLAKPNDPRSVSLLPPFHIAVAERGQVLPDLFDLFARLPTENGMPSCLSLITGPSKTGDIELRLVTGVHGPGEIHVVLVNA